MTIRDFLDEKAENLLYAGIGLTLWFASYTFIGGSTSVTQARLLLLIGFISMIITGFALVKTINNIRKELSFR